MDNQTAWSVTKAQLALDLGCDPALFDVPGNQIILWKDCPGRRKYSNQTPILEIAVHNSKLVAACSAELLEPCRALWGGYFRRMAVLPQIPSSPGGHSLPCRL